MTYQNFSGEWQECSGKMIRATAYLNFKNDEATLWLEKSLQLPALCRIQDQHFLEEWKVDKFDQAGQALVNA